MKSKTEKQTNKGKIRRQQQRPGREVNRILSGPGRAQGADARSF